MNLDDYIPPLPIMPDDRFWSPVRVFGHAVIPLRPCSDEPIDPGPELPHELEFGISTDDEITSLDRSPFNVGMLCGKASGVTVLQVITQAAQAWLDQQDLPVTPRWWSRRSRCYLFNYVGEHLVSAETDIHRGLKLLNDGAQVIYPGSIYEDGRLVAWEHSPDDVQVADFPSWLYPAAGSSTVQ